ncbi:MAG: GNAT family N-acetyltransferase, partial [Candidatus Lokiarchaeota archaeon]|nr:GNAT family N-acetyltransferase [Candidatus Lokiarchaeota archaeon]
ERVLDLTLRNGMIVAKVDGKLVGWGTYSQFKDYLGKVRVLIHQIMVRKEDAYKKGIEEQIIRELEKYIKNTLNFDKAYYIGIDSDNNLQSVFMKLGIEKSEFIWYEKEL